MISTVTLLVAPLTLILLLLSIYALTTATGFFNRMMIIVLLLAGMGVSFISFNHLLSLPKPTSMEWVFKHIEEIEILYAVIQRNEAIYLWMNVPDTKEPRYYVLEWNDEQAKQLQKAMREKSSSRVEGKITMKNPFDNSMEDRKPEIKFVPISKQLPDKSYEINE